MSGQLVKSHLGKNSAPQAATGATETFREIRARARHLNLEFRTKSPRRRQDSKIVPGRGSSRSPRIPGRARCGGAGFQPVSPDSGESESRRCGVPRSLPRFWGETSRSPETRNFITPGGCQSPPGQPPPGGLEPVRWHPGVPNSFPRWLFTFRPDRKNMASAPSDVQLRAWEAASEELAREINTRKRGGSF